MTTFCDPLILLTTGPYGKTLKKACLDIVSCLSLTFDLTFGFGIVIRTKSRAHTFNSTKNSEAKVICFFELLHCLVCQILHQSPDKGSQKNMPFQAQTWRYIVRGTPTAGVLLHWVIISRWWEQNQKRDSESPINTGSPRKKKNLQYSGQTVKSQAPKHPELTPFYPNIF